MQHDDSRWLASLLPGALDIPVLLSHVLMGACSVGAVSCSRLLIQAKADIYEQMPPGQLGEGDTALNVALKTYARSENSGDDRMRAGARACALMLLECSPGFGDKDPFIFSSEHAMDLLSCCAPMHLHGQLTGVGMLPAVQLLLAARVDPNVAFDYNALIRGRVADDEGEGPPPHTQLSPHARAPRYLFHLRTPPHTSPHLPTPPHTSSHLPISQVLGDLLCLDYARRERERGAGTGAGTGGTRAGTGVTGGGRSDLPATLAVRPATVTPRACFTPPHPGARRGHTMTATR